MTFEELDTCLDAWVAGMAEATSIENAAEFKVWMINGERLAMVYKKANGHLDRSGQFDSVAANLTQAYRDWSWSRL